MRDGSTTAPTLATAIPMRRAVSSTAWRAARSPFCGGLEQVGHPARGVAAAAARPARGQALQPGQRLQAPAGAEVHVDVLRPHAHDRDLAGHEVVAAVQLAVDEHARRRCRCPRRGTTQVSWPRAAPAPVLAEHGEVDVVLDDDRRFQRALQDVAHGHVRPAAAGSGAKATTPRRVVDDAGHAHRHREQLLGRGLGVLHQRAHGGGHARRAAPPGRCRRGWRTMRWASGSPRRSATERRVRVGPRSMPATKPWRALNSMKAGRRPPRDGPAPSSRTRPLRMSDVNEAADGGGGEAGGLDQLRAREAVGAVHRHAEHAIEVEAAQVAESPPDAVPRGTARHDKERRRLQSVSGFTLEESLKKSRRSDARSKFANPNRMGRLVRLLRGSLE